MKIQKHLIKVIYLCLLAACIGIVVMLTRLAEPKPPETESAATELMVEESESTLASPSEVPEVTKEEKPQEETAAAETEYRDWQKAVWYDSDRENGKGDEEETVKEEPYAPPVLMIATDLHYYSEELTDGGEAFMARVLRDDGKILWYSDAMVDALMDEALKQKPAALILSGDISFDGEKENHIRLAKKLARVQEQVQVLVIPGNHDINSNAAVYYGAEKIDVETVDREGFLDIYHAFGYEQAFSRDTASLSYMYAFDETHWAMMLDTCQYDPVNRVNGKVKAETLEWIREQLEYALECGAQVLPVGHHNLLYQSRLYTADCTMENHLDLVRLLEAYRIPLYISGHLHAQRVKEYQEAPGLQTESPRITEIVLSPYSIPACQYGQVAWDEDGRISMVSRQVSISDWAREWGSTDEDLLNFDQLAPEWTKQIIKNQVKKTLYALPEEQKECMAALYAEVYYHYTKGHYLSKADIEHSEAWALWNRMEADPVYTSRIRQMMEDCQKSHEGWSLSH